MAFFVTYLTSDVNQGGRTAMPAATAIASSRWSGASTSFVSLVLLLNHPKTVDIDGWQIYHHVGGSHRLAEISWQHYQRIRSHHAVMCVEDLVADLDQAPGHKFVDAKRCGQETDSANQAVIN